MAAPGATVRGRADRAAETLVAAVLRNLSGVWIASEVRKVPEVRAILESPDEVRRQCLLLLAGPDGYLLAPGQHYADQVVHVLSVIARRRVGLTCADLEAILDLPPAELRPEQTLWITDKIRGLGRQIEHAYAGLNRDDQARVKPLLERAASEIRYPPAAVRIRKLTGSGQEIRYELIGDADDVGPRLRAVIEASPEPDEARAAVLNLLAAFPATGRPGKAWHAEAERVRGLLARPANASAAAIAEAGLPASVTELLVLERSIRQGALLKQIRKAIDALAADHTGDTGR